MLPSKVGYSLASIVADITYLAWPRGRNNARRNMLQVLGGEIGQSTVDRLARQSLRNYCKYLVDFVLFPRLTREELEHRIHFRGWEKIETAYQEGKGVIFVTLHFGNWDLAAAAMVLHNYPLNVIVETFKFSKLNDLVVQARRNWGMKTIPMEKAARKVVEVLRRSEMLAILIDNPTIASERGVAVDFFDCVTKVPAGAATLALRTGAKVVTGGVVRLPDNTFVAIVDRCLDYQRSGNLEKDIEALTQRIMDSLENVVRQYPDQWYMFRRMWA